jgi:hypothetical protein
VVIYQWAHVLPLSRQWVAIPALGKFITVMLNIVEEEGVQKPYMLWVVPLQEMEALQTGKECPPATGKVSATLQPQPFDPSVVCRAKTHQYM